MTKLSTLKNRWMKKPGFKENYEALRPEFELIGQLIGARIKSGLTQAELAKRMQTSQSAIARLEGGASKPSLTTLNKFAKATNSEIHIQIKPITTSRARAVA